MKSGKQHLPLKQITINATYFAISSFSNLYSIFFSSGKASGVRKGSFSFSDFGGTFGFEAC
jgi:hypothetical protein